MPNHNKCIECIHPDCVKKKEKEKNLEVGSLKDAEDKCVICNYDELKNKPVIKLECGH